MSNYPQIEGILGSLFSADVARPNEEADALLRASLADRDFRGKLKAELESAFLDHNWSWKRALAEYEVYWAETEEEARRHAVEILWMAVCPDISPPSAQTQAR